MTNKNIDSQSDLGAYTNNKQNIIIHWSGWIWLSLLLSFWNNSQIFKVLFALLVDYVVYIIWPWSNRVGRRYKDQGSLRVESSSMGKTVTPALKVDEILQCKKSTFALAKRDPGLLNTTRKLLCLTLIYLNIIHLERIFTLCLNVGGGWSCNLMGTEDLFSLYPQIWMSYL